MNAKHPKSADSENEDLRSVIDDLTVKNKRLKRKLKHLQKGPLAPSVNDSRLFEVHIHELSNDKKRELESILRNFASTLNHSHGRSQTTSGLKSSVNASDTALTDSSSANTAMVRSNGQSSYASLVNAPAVSKASGAVPSDSAYASMSRFGRSNSGATSNYNSLQERRRPPTPNTSKDKKIHSYLRDIPQSLLPQHNPIMNERTKMKTVVRRLEQLFTGTRAAPGEHSLPLQQQAISDSAAQADQASALQSNDAIPTEGSREAKILHESAAKDMDRDLNPNPPSPTLARKNGDDLAVDAKTSDQRPTRPLDLDMHRAQIASDNIEYIRHLGLSYPNTASASTNKPGRWVYLNLLASMAQLHVLNVTPEFIRKSISTLSDKLEISNDGRKLRWRGGTHGTAFSSESSSNVDGQSESSPERISQQNATSKAPCQTDSTTLSESKMPSDSLHQIKLSEPESATSGTGEWLGKLNLRTNNPHVNPFDYKPLFVKYNSTDSDDSLEYQNGFSNSPGVADTTTAAADSCLNSLSRTRSKSEKDIRIKHGPIVFYNNSSFFTDLSGDRSSVNRSKEPINVSQGSILGAPKVPNVDGTNTPKFEWQNSTESPLPPYPTPIDLELSPLIGCGKEVHTPRDLEASGIGGVIPSDNFIVHVQTRHEQHRSSTDVPAITPSARRQRGSQPSRHQVISASRTTLPASTLPPPSYILSYSSLSSSNVGDLGESSTLDDVPLSAESTSRAFATRVAPGTLDVDDKSDSTESDVSSDSDSEIDMLRPARAIDPAAVQEQERAFEVANMRILGGVLSPGSSAATAGGFESDIESNATSHGSDEEDNSRTRSLKRARIDTEPERVAKAPRVQIDEH